MRYSPSYGSPDVFAAATSSEHPIAVVGMDDLLEQRGVRLPAVEPVPEQIDDRRADVERVARLVEGGDVQRQRHLLDEQPVAFAGTHAVVSSSCRKAPLGSSVMGTPWSRQSTANGRSSSRSTLRRVSAGSSWYSGGTKRSAVAVVRDQVGADEHAGVALEQERVVRPLRTGRPDRQQPAGEHVALGVAPVGLLVAGACVLRQPDLDPELGAVPPRRSLVRRRVERDRGRRRQRGEQLVVETDGVDEHAAAVHRHRVRAGDGPADARVVDAPVPDAVDDLLDAVGDLARFRHAHKDCTRL